MELERALEILRGLRDGRDVTSGEDLAPDSVCQRPEVLRALFAAVQQLEGGNGARARPPRAGSPWNPEEESELLAGFDEGVPQAELARRSGRSRNAVRTRLVKLGRLEPAAAPV